MKLYLSEKTFYTSQIPVRAAGIIEAVISHDRCLESFHPIDLHELITISPSKLSTCILNPIPTTLLKEVLPLASPPLLNIINISLVTGYVPQLK